MEEEEKYYSKYALKGSLSLESYQDYMHFKYVYDDKIDNIINSCFKLLNELDKQADLASSNEKINIWKKECEELNKVFDYLGRKNFIFYDDGDVNYKKGIYGKKGC